MSGAIQFWFKAVALACVIGTAGYAIAAICGRSLFGGILAGLGVVVLCCASCLLGAAGILHALERSEVAHIPDGRDDVTITLKLGAFACSRTIPVTKQHSDTQVEK